MSSSFMRYALLSAGVAALTPFAASAATVTGWDTSNVEVGPATADTAEGAAASVVYDGDPNDPASTSNGQIYYAAPEADTPGLEVLNGDYSSGGNSYDGCIIASSTAECDSEFQSGKRFKEQVTSEGSTDLVFTVEDDGSVEDAIYQVFQRVVNVTNEALSGIVIELGHGVGDDFVASTDADGLSITTTIELGPDNVAAFTQYPFGLFGDVDTQPNPNPDFSLDGFFDGESRAGFTVDISEDAITSTGFYGSYDDLFAAWLPQSAVPDGLLWDWADGAADPLVMAWDTGAGWEVRRGVDDSLDGVLGDLSVNDVYALAEDDWLLFGYDELAELEAFLGVPVFEDAIEDLANLNVSYAISVNDSYAYDSFTIRTTVIAAPPAVVPLPTTAPLLAGAIGLIGFVRRRRSAAKAA